MAIFGPSNMSLMMIDVGFNVGKPPRLITKQQLVAGDVFFQVITRGSSLDCQTKLDIWMISGPDAFHLDSPGPK